jgi:site-specific recombinase XerD
MTAQLVPTIDRSIETPAETNRDSHVVRMWLHGKSQHTQRSYARVIRQFQAFTGGKPLAAVTLSDIQDYADSLCEKSTATQASALAAIKSLLSFGHRLGYLQFDTGKPVKLPKVRNRLAERFLEESEVYAMFAHEPDARNRAILRTLYFAGLRVSEAVSLRWRDVQPRDDGGQLTVHGKGDKTRTILLPDSIYRELVQLRDNAAGDDPVFVSRKGGHLSAMQIHRVVQAAARRAGIERDVSPHWLRHCHASHSIERGCPLHVLSATLGHSSVAVTSVYLHSRPTDSSARYLGGS